MYTPKSYEQNDLDELYEFIKSNTFGTLISQIDDSPFATHIPFMLKRDESPSGAVLIGHMARANPHWKAITPDTKVLVIFHGAHHYISPKWYMQQNNVPTWNYMVAHVYGTIDVIDSSEKLLEMVAELAGHHETKFETYWNINSLSPEQLNPLLQSIVGIRLNIERIEGKYKLNQNRSMEDQQGVVDALTQYDYSDAQIIRDRMQENLKG